MSASFGNPMFSSLVTNRRQQDPRGILSFEGIYSEECNCVDHERSSRDTGLGDDLADY
jgi:hypothetical protein